MAVSAAASEPSHVARSFEVVPDWRRIDDEGYAVRLSPTQTFQPGHVTGRWRAVDTNLPYTGWRSSRRATGAGLWAVLIALFGWLGWSKGRGPLAELASYRHTEDGGDGETWEADGAWGADVPVRPDEVAGPGQAARPHDAARPDAAASSGPDADGQRLPPLFEDHALDASRPRAERDDAAP
jgi:hypothetical protein